MKRRRSEDLLTTIAEHIRTRRKTLGLTQEELAERAGLSTNYVAKLEIGMNAPSLQSLSRLAEALQIDLGALVTLGRTFSHTDRVEAVAQMMESLDEQEEEVLIGHIRSMVELMKSMRDRQ